MTPQIPTIQDFDAIARAAAPRHDYSLALVRLGDDLGNLPDLTDGFRDLLARHSLMSTAERRKIIGGMRTAVDVIDIALERLEAAECASLGHSILSNGVAV